ncbi:hypothetical protein B0H14DRAFT_3158292 [Mycena olivaceomarginata]|nr:hypothetical protein B0H14DRAFT_3158292 [Mycena olivaceomarginata]
MPTEFQEVCNPGFAVLSLLPTWTGYMAVIPYVIIDRDLTIDAGASTVPRSCLCLRPFTLHDLKTIYTTTTTTTATYHTRTEPPQKKRTLQDESTLGHALLVLDAAGSTHATNPIHHAHTPPAFPAPLPRPLHPPPLPTPACPSPAAGMGKAREMRVCSRQIGGMAATPSDVAARRFEHAYEDVHRSDSAFAVFTNSMMNFGEQVEQKFLRPQSAGHSFNFIPPFVLVIRMLNPTTSHAIDANTSIRDDDSAESLLHSAVELLKISRKGFCKADKGTITMLIEVRY